MFLRFKTLSNRPMGSKMIFIAFVVAFALFLMPFSVNGATIFEDDFEAYELGALSGQGDWGGYITTGIAVVSDFVHGGTKSVLVRGGSGRSNYRYGEEQEIGSIGFWVRFKAFEEPPGENMALYLRNPIHHEVIRMNFGCVEGLCSTNGVWLKYRDGIESSWITHKDTMNDEEWALIQVEWNGSINEARFQINDLGWGDWFNPYTSAFSIIAFNIMPPGNYLDPNYDLAMWLDEISEAPKYAELNITSPTPASEMTGAFDIVGTYDFGDEDWERIYIYFEQWNASSTCPISYSSEWWEEWEKGWWYYGSLWFFSDFLSTTTGEFLISIDDLRLGNYNCAKCFFINETEHTISSEKCQGYNLKVVDKIYPELPYRFPFKTWEEYYEEKSVKFTTSTALFQGIADALSPIADKMGGFILYVKDYFDPDEAMAKGIELGQAIPKARGYLTLIDDFFGELPLSSFFTFYLLIIAVVISYKVILQILKLLKL